MLKKSSRSWKPRETFPPLPLMAQPAAPKNGRTSVTLEYNGHTIEALASSSTNRYWGVEVTLTWTDGMIENKMKFGPYEISCSQNDAEAWGVLAALRWIDAGKPNTEALITLH